MSERQDMGASAEADRATRPADQAAARLGDAASILSADVLRSVVAHCEASGPGMWTDAAIAAGVGWKMLKTVRGGITGLAPLSRIRVRVPKYSRSLDAALTLVPGDAQSVSLDALYCWPEGPFESEVTDWDGNPHTAEAATLALALCAAALKARAASAIEAATAGETVQQGSTEGESAVAKPDAQPPSGDS